VIKTVLVPASGSSTDDAVFATALAAARALTAHLDFYHVALSTGQAAVRAPHVDFCIGEALPAALQVVRDDTARLSEEAVRHFHAFRARHALDLRDTPERALTVSASFLEEKDYAQDRLRFHALHSDLVVLGRPSHTDYLPPHLIEDLLVGCGRPILIAPDYSPKTLPGTVVVGWKETAHCARALAAAYPFLQKAEKVILLNIIEDGVDLSEALEHLAQRLQWHGIHAETQSMAGTSRTIAKELARAAAGLHADLLVVGAYSHRHLREEIFGGVTQSLLEYADLPVFMMY
jgi:nucleotide-binding universal stress UspA family protein